MPLSKVERSHEGKSLPQPRIGQGSNIMYRIQSDRDRDTGTSDVASRERRWLTVLFHANNELETEQSWC